MLKLNVFFRILILLICCNKNVFSQTLFLTSSTELNGFLKTNYKSVILIDARDSSMFNSGYIKNAININAFWKDAPTIIENHLSFDTIIVYCTTQRRSEKLIEIIQSTQFKGILYYMTDGITGWKKNGYELVHP